MAPPQIVDTHYRHQRYGSDDSGQVCLLPEMLASHRFKAASRKIINAMSHAQHVSISPRLSSIIFEKFNQIKQIRNVTC